MAPYNTFFQTTLSTGTTYYLMDYWGGNATLTTNDDRTDKGSWQAWGFEFKNPGGLVSEDSVFVLIHLAENPPTYLTSSLSLTTDKSEAACFQFESTSSD